MQPIITHVWGEECIKGAMAARSLPSTIIPLSLFMFLQSPSRKTFGVQERVFVEISFRFVHNYGPAELMFYILSWLYHCVLF